MNAKIQHSLIVLHKGLGYTAVFLCVALGIVAIYGGGVRYGCAFFGLAIAVCPMDRLPVWSRVAIGAICTWILSFD
ncbi:hypothetical protein ACQ4M3_01015 [Leptolyngbya sp. AN03gr2]|uniref:hypothetical protein n=1 Tax=unclassified Leptolyngbya TaxID=2650499 RepID=UPI003D313916